MGQILTGSICLSDIPRDQIKEVACKDGVKRKFLNIAVIERREVGRYGDTHFVSCAPRKEDRKEGIDYIIGDLKAYSPQPARPTAEAIDAANPAENFDDLPF